MSNYAEMTTAELIDLLFKEEDRVTLEHIQELVGRGNEAKPRLLEILHNEDYWYEGQRGDFWIPLHTVVILSSMRDPKLLPELLSVILHSYFSEQEWVTDRWPELLSQFGEAAVEPLIHYILENRTGHRDNIDYSFARAQAAKALVRIALENPPVRQRVLDFLCELFADPQETDAFFLSQIIICPAAIGRQAGINAVEAVFNRRVITQSAYGKQHQVLDYLRNRRNDLMDDFRENLFDFYDPEAISVRQERWASEDRVDFGEEVYNRAYVGPAPFPLPFERMYSNSELNVPQGYAESSSGNIVRLEKVGRNDPCPCGSGKKFKKCCGQ